MACYSEGDLATPSLEGPFLFIVLRYCYCDVIVDNKFVVSKAMHVANWLGEIGIALNNSEDSGPTPILDR